MFGQLLMRFFFVQIELAITQEVHAQAEQALLPLLLPLLVQPLRRLLQPLQLRQKILRLPLQLARELRQVIIPSCCLQLLLLPRL